MFIAILAVVGLMSAPLTLTKMEKANAATLQVRQEQAFKDTERKIEKEYGLPRRYTLGEVRARR